MGISSFSKVSMGEKFDAVDLAELHIEHKKEGNFIPLLLNLHIRS